MINTPIVIAATAAARFSSARAALGQSDRSATSSYGDLLAAKGMSPEIAHVGTVESNLKGAAAHPERCVIAQQTGEISTN